MEKVIIEKKTIIYTIILIICCAVSFSIGRFVRFGRASGNSKELIERVLQGRAQTDRILEQLNISKSSADSAEKTGQLIADGIERLAESNKVQRFLISKLESEIADTERRTNEIKSALAGAANSFEYGFEIAIEQSKSYERIVRTLSEIPDNSSKNE